MIRFRSKINKLGINPVVDPPDDVIRSILDQAGRSKGPVPVRGHINGAAFTQTLVKFRGAWRLYINGPMLKSSGLDVGDVADIEIEFDRTPREIAMHPELERALRTNPTAKIAFERLTPSRRNEILRYINSLKTAEAIVKNVERVLDQLRSKTSE